MLILDGKRVSESVKSALKTEIKDFLKVKGRQPGLAVVRVGEDPASAVYVKNKISACEYVGIRSFHHHLSALTSFLELKKLLEALNADVKVDGILVQLPLPAQLGRDEVLRLIDPSKDADGLGENPQVVPCTPAGVMEILKFYNIEIKNKNAVVVGRSAIVGKPMAMLLEKAGARVSVVHSKTENPKSITSQADLIVVAAGKPGLIGKSDLKKDVVVVDVGIHRTKKGLCGDVRFEELEGFASAATPVPGGVGPMTIAMLLRNTLELAKKK